jgi:23S rRNA U2552 (ribose-2'-O)-methylase RlmE/FtsJ
MMYEIADEMNETTSMLKDLPARPKVLDICMAPGGFSGIILKRIAGSRIVAITLPVDKGGHEILIPNWKADTRIKVHFVDLTLLSAEMGVEHIPPEHPDADEFLTLRPFPMMKVDLVFCDGQVLRTHTRSSYRESRERERLINSQFVLALQRVQKGGTIVSRLHKVEALDTVNYLQIFSKFSSIQLFKPARKHASRSSFYVIAKDVQPQSPEALHAVETWKKDWAAATFNVEDATHPKQWDADQNDIIELLDAFGPQLKCLGAPIWKIQADGLCHTHYVRDKLAEIEEVS